MKRFLTALVGVAVLTIAFFLCLKPYHAGPTPLFNGNVTTTAYSSTNSVSALLGLNNLIFLFSDTSGITNGTFPTNSSGQPTAVTATLQYTIDPNNSNWITCYSNLWNPTTTNAEADSVTFGAPSNQITLYFRVLFTSTNPIPIAAFRTQ